MVRINKIYTKTGDDGTTALVDGSRVSKSDPRVCAYGDVDELNSLLGIIRTFSDIECAEKKEASILSMRLAIIQNDLFDIGGNLATPKGFDKYPVFRVTDATIQKLESWIDEATAVLPPLTSFVLPGGTKINAFLHLARTVCRRTERILIPLMDKGEVDKEIIIYFNRLSDLLFALCRIESQQKGDKEYLWKPSKVTD